MSGAGKPLHFLGWVLGGWLVLRIGIVAMPMPAPQSEEREESSPETERKKPPIAARTDRAVSGLPVQRTSGRTDGSTAHHVPLIHRPALELAILVPVDSGASNRASALSMLVSASREQAPPTPMESPAPQPAASSLPPPARMSRWSLTGWLLWRQDTRASLAQAPLLGGSQSGIRLDYHLWSKGGRSLAVYGRLTRALERPFAEEAAVGVALRPVEGVPVSIMAERRQKLGTGGRSGFAFLAAGGIGPKPIVPRLELEGYGQAGVVMSPDAAGFADGKLALDYRLMPKSAPDLAIGFSVSGGAQPGVARLDIGPELRLRLPVAGGHVRLSAEWRQRIAGAARPASGPTLALVADF
ncbi:MAG: hypothetical protein J7494_02835 [Sphingobium sp.]|nr:hypothetical protein [Sphingobium sp.]